METLAKPIIPTGPGSVPVCDVHGLKKAFEYTIFEEQKVMYFCDQCSEKLQQEQNDRAEAVKAMQRKLLVERRLEESMISPRFKDKTLSNWDASSPEQKKVLKIAKDFLENDRSPGLIFIGKPGTGKNHLACGIAVEYIKNHFKTALVTSTMKLLRAIKECWNNKEQLEANVIKKFKDVDLLVIDEIGVQFCSETESIYITEIINERYEWLKPTILISNLNMIEITKLLGDRVIDRFREGGEVAVFNWESKRRESYEGK